LNRLPSCNIRHPVLLQRVARALGVSVDALLADEPAKSKKRQGQ
jgi:hypothetical protein